MPLSAKLAGFHNIMEWIPANLQAAIIAGTGTADLAPYFAAANSALNTGGTYTGGRLWIPNGYYKLNSAFVPTTTNAGGVISLVIQGANEHDTVLDFSGTSAPTTDCIVLTNLVGIALRDFKVTSCATGANIAATTISLADFRNLRSQAAHTDGIKIDHSYMVHLQDMWSTLNGNDGFNFGSGGYNTSIIGENLYAYKNTSQYGIQINNTTYSSFNAVGSDQNKWGYGITNVRGVSFNGCGAESNIFQGWVITASAAGVNGALEGGVDGLTLNGCFNYGNNTNNAASGTASSSIIAQSDSSGLPLNVTLNGVSDDGQPSNIPASLYASGKMNILEFNPGFKGTQVTANGPLLTIMQNGTMSLPKLAAAPTTAPGAGNAQLFVVPGTTTGCKLQALAGTSTTPVTIVDNVGTGC